MVITDHPPAATDTIPHVMKRKGEAITTKKLEPGIWELTITKK